MAAVGQDPSALLVSAIESGPLGFMVLAVDGRVLHANRAACQLLGRKRSEVVGRGVTELVHPDDRGWSEDEFELLPAAPVGSVRQELRVVAGGGAEVWVELNVRSVSLADGGSIYAVATIEDTTDRRLREYELRQLADADPLTGLLNRRRFTLELDRHIASVRRYGIRGALLMIDIDGLKLINDTYGHRSGDAALLGTAALLRSRLRTTDVMARIGGDEFAVLLPEATTAQAAAVAGALLDTVPGHPAASATARPPMSIGIATVGDGELDAADLLDRADAAMYKAKRSGGDAFTVNGEPPKAH